MSAAESIAVPWPQARLWSAGYREWLPAAELRATIACFWVSVTPLDAAPQPSAVLPDLCSDLIWQRGRGAFIAGPDTGPVRTETMPGAVLVGARFRPGAGGAALDIPLAELRDQRVDLADILPRLAGSLAADLDPVQALAAVTKLSARLATAGPPDQLVLEATRLLATGRASVASLSPELAVSERHLRRRFDHAVGYGPKTMHRVLRFRAVLARLALPGPVDLAELALRAGYADQAHLTREMTRLAGQPPARLARQLAQS
jgi:AraC-like DNA-binding protein